VDTDPERIEHARLSPEGVVFSVIRDQLYFIEGYFDGAVANFVFAKMDSIDTQQRALAEIYRVLKLNSPVVLLNNNPSATGVRFARIQSGETGKTYEPGQLIPLRNPRTDGTYVSEEVWWSQEHYENLMKNVGFRNVKTSSEKLGDQHLRIMHKLGVDPDVFVNERVIAPYISVVGYK